MKTFSLRATIPLTTLPTAPAIFRMVLPNAVVKSVMARCSETANPQQVGWKLTNQGLNVFPNAGDGLNPNEDGYSPFMGAEEVPVQETLSGPPYNVEVICFNLTAAAVYIDILILTDGKEKARQVETVLPSDIETNKLVN